MFTGIVEVMGQVEQIAHEGTNVHFSIASSISHALKIDQSISHNGVCLTVVAQDEKTHTVTAIHETLDRTNLDQLRQGSQVNLERCMEAGGRYDGHIVQGHVDERAKLKSVKDENGSWVFQFQLDKPHQGLIVEKGSITVNGISLTVASVSEAEFTVAIIPYTYEHTNLQNLNQHDEVNIEFDILGKYVAAMLARRS